MVRLTHSFGVRKTEGGVWSAAERVEIGTRAGQIDVDLMRPEVATSHQELVYRLTARSDLPVGPFTDTVALRPEGRKSHLYVPVRGRIVPCVVVIPNTLLFLISSDQKMEVSR